MTDVKIVVAGIEMTPEQARKVHAELSRLFAPSTPPFDWMDRVANPWGQKRPANPLQPGLRETDFGRYPDSAYVLRFSSLDNAEVARGLKKDGGGC